MRIHGKYFWKASFLILSVSGLFALICFPRTLRADGETPGVSTGHGRHARGGQGANSQSSHSAIHGHCTVAQSADNPIAGACASLVLILNDSQGNELGRTRTSSSGDFEFDLLQKPSGRYSIVPGSHFYRVVSSEQGSEHGEINLSLQQE